MPAYFVLDAAALAGAPGSTVVALRRIDTELRPRADLVVRTIVYDEEARLAARADEAAAAAVGGHALGGALRTLSSCLEADEAGRPAPARDFKPLVFVVAAGLPADEDWLPVAASVRMLAELRLLNVFAFSGDRSTAERLLALTPAALCADGESGIADCIGWAVDTTAATVRLAGRASARRKLVRPPSLPAGISLVGG